MGNNRKHGGQLVKRATSYTILSLAILTAWSCNSNSTDGENKIVDGNRMAVDQAFSDSTSVITDTTSTTGMLKDARYQPDIPDGLKIDARKSDAKRVDSGFKDAAVIKDSGLADAKKLDAIRPDLNKSDSGGNNYYVAKNGNDNNMGTEDKPWLTINKAANTLKAGDTVNIKAGTYHERVNINVQGNAQSGYITFRNYGNDLVIIDGTGFNLSNPWGGLIQAIGKSYIRIQGFHVRNTQGGSNGGAIVVTGDRGASHLEILDNEITAHNGGNAIGCRGNNLSYVLINNNEVHHCNTGSQEAIRVDKGTYYFKITNNRVYNNTNIGIDCVGWGVQPAYGLIKNNTLYRNGLNSGGAHAIYVDGGTYITIEDNVCYDNQGGISVGAEYAGEIAHHIIVRRNVLYNGWVKGITVGGSKSNNGRAKNCTIIHNTLFNNNAGSWSNELKINYFQGTNVFKNNIIYNTDISSVYLIENITSPNPENMLIDYNSYFPTNAWFAYKNSVYRSLSAWQTATGQDYHSIAQNPAFIDAPKYNFQLQTNSPCKDVGDFLTRTTRSGSGTVIPVVDARAFCDGYGGWFPGDLIQVGLQGPVRITQVNYSNNTISVNQILSWKSNDGVSLPFSGSKPDMGAYEF